jgi:hypothetical protein
MDNLIKYENFTDSHLEESSENLEHNAFESTCIEEGISFMDLDSLYESEEAILEAEEGKKKGGFLKILGKVAGGLSKIAGPILSNLGIPMGGAIAGVLGKLSQGLAGIKPKEGQKLSAAAKEAPQMKQVSDVVKGTLDKVTKDITARGPEALFSKSNRDSILSLAAILQSADQANKTVKKEIAASSKAV